jgi:tricorn protease
MRAKYEPFLEHAATRTDVNRIIQWMCSELAVGHHRGGGGDRLEKPKSVPGGLLGTDFEIANGRYRFKKVYGGLNWSPELRTPLTAPGVDVKTGEYLLAVAGKDVRPPAEVYAFFENTAGKTIEITVGPNPDGKNSRTVTVRPVADEIDLRNRDWVESNLRKVHAATNGRVAYVYVPDTATMGLLYFKRYFYPQVDKEAVIIDERFNSGGQVADYYIDALRRPFITYWAPRYGADWITPSAAIFGPKVMLIDENAGSGGDLLPWMFRKLGLGKLVGKRTWGGLVGLSGTPVLMDGGQITAPNFAIWNEEGWIVENEGVPPDIDVEQTPREVIAGRDPQLEKAIAIVLEELKRQPTKKPPRPPYAIRVRPTAPSKRLAAESPPAPVGKR